MDMIQIFEMILMELAILSRLSSTYTQLLKLSLFYCDYAFFVCSSVELLSNLIFFPDMLIYSQICMLIHAIERIAVSATTYV